MIRISKEEVDMLMKNGFKYGDDLHKTYTKYPHYYATQGTKLMSVLNKYRNSKIVN